jgi:hypothetical protein
MTTLQLSALLFGIAALGGVTLAGIRLTRHANPPMALAMLHGLGAAAGLALLAWTAWRVGVDVYAGAALALFLLAAAGGAFLNLRFHRRGITLPVGLMLAHAGTAVLAFVLLLTSLFAPS